MMPESEKVGGVCTIRHSVKNIKQESWVCTICTFHHTSEDSKVIVCDRCEGCTCTIQAAYTLVMNCMSLLGGMMSFGTVKTVQQ